MEIDRHDLTTSDVYMSYEEDEDPISDDTAKHPAAVCEGALLNCVDDKEMFKNYELRKPPNSKLSLVQIEAVKAICGRHLSTFELEKDNLVRAGFLLGDGTGMGKTRVICQCILENWAEGRTLHLVLTTSTSLELDFRREMQVLDANFCDKFFNLKSYKLHDISEGIIFTTYSMLNTKRPNEPDDLVDQLLRRLGDTFDGLLVFDECHMAKNYLSQQNNKPSQTGLNVMRLQTQLRMARVLYVSATGMGDAKHFAYLNRLGLWGIDRTFVGPDEFLRTISAGGASCMEFVAYQLKCDNAFLSRHISMDGVKSSTIEVGLDGDFYKLYDECCHLWRLLFKYAETMADESLAVESSSNVMSMMGGSYLRFFGALIVAAKIPKCLEITRNAIDNGKQVVIGLQTTGEALYSKKPSHSGYSLLRSMFENLTHYYFQFDINELTETCEFEDDLVALRREIRSRFKALAHNLPRNTLDYLIQELGGIASVAEITGRICRETTHTQEGYIVNARTKPDQENFSERNSFQKGVKKVCIISDAASVGISLHADASIPEVKPRIQITIELPWSADRLVQQLGRTHRSNSKYPSEYIFIETNVPGEKRFKNVVSERINALSAFTQGDRRCGLNLFLNTSLPRVSGKELFENLITYLDESDNVESLIESCVEFDILRRENEDVKMSRNCKTTNSFFNKLMGLPLDVQKTLFTVVKDLADDLETESSQDAIMVLGENYYVRSIKQEFVPNTRNKLLFTKILYDTAYPIEHVYENCDDHELVYSQNKASNIIHIGYYNDDGEYVLYSSFSMFPVELSKFEFDVEFKVLDKEIGHKLYVHQYENLHCERFYNGECKINRCNHPKRQKPFYALCGDVLRFFNKLKSLFGSITFVRINNPVATLVGVLVPRQCVCNDKLLVQI